MAMEIEGHPKPSARVGAGATPRAGPMLALWMSLTIALQGVLWLSGFKEAALTEAIERGAARAELQVIGEVRDDLIRKAIRTQRDSQPFWTTLSLIGDFAVEPLALAIRAVAVATAMSSLAALTGRPVGFARALADNAAAQGYWVLGLAFRVALMLALRRQDVETSMALALSPGTHPATALVALRQLDAFALLGWMSLVRGAWRRGQANLMVAALTCSLLWLGEATLRIGSTLVAEAGMRLMLLPE